MIRKLVVVSAGTYHLPFTRLVDWMEPWVLRHDDVRVVMQHGPTRPLKGAENHDLLAYADLLALCERADAIVLQGGAGAVMDMRVLRRIPIVVPRVPVDGEVVDDHQLIFTAQAERLGAIRRVTERDALWDELEGALAGSWDTHAPAGGLTHGIVQTSTILETLPSPLARAEKRRRLSRTLRSFFRPGRR